MEGWGRGGARPGAEQIAPQMLRAAGSEVNIEGEEFGSDASRGSWQGWAGHHSALGSLHVFLSPLWIAPYILLCLLPLSASL